MCHICGNAEAVYWKNLAREKEAQKVAGCQHCYCQTVCVIVKHRVCCNCGNRQVEMNPTRQSR